MQQLIEWTREQLETRSIHPLLMIAMGAKSRWISAIRIPFRYLIKSLEVQQQAA